MPSKKPADLQGLGLFTATQARKRAGISQPTLSRWVRDGAIEKVARGFYLYPDAKLPRETLDFEVACAKFGPRSAIGGLSALFHHRLIDRPAEQVWVVVPPSVLSRNSFYRCLRTKTPTTSGIEKHEHFRITDIERTLLESMKFAPKIGARTAIHAARTALREGRTSEKKLGEMAKKLKLTAVLAKFWEAIVEP